MSINKIVLNTDSGEQVLVDLTGDNVTADKMLQGTTAHDKAGENITGTIESFDGSYECSGESTGGGGTAIEAWTGTVSVFAGLGSGAPTLYYTDETLTPQIIGNGSAIYAEITIVAGTILYFSTHVDFTTMDNVEDVTGYNDAGEHCSVIHPTANGFTLSNQ